jgi:uncharacterized heparinase superfamily protein
MMIVNPTNDADVKFPWELSRLQWLIPVGQAYLLTGDERYARAARDVLDEWIAGNPYAMTVNWAIAMEPAIRILTWTWLFHAFHRSDEWGDDGFRSRFLSSLYLHADFVERNLERTDINGNHLTADAAGLVFAGLFFGQGARPSRWQQLGWQLLMDELPQQVHSDGVDFEASAAYHRLVLELFLLPALYRERLALQTPDNYRARLVAMARFVAAYSRSNGTSPLWGDADDGRALPLGPQPVTDHRYLVGLVAATWDVAELRDEFGGPREEVLWLLGHAAAESLVPSLKDPTSASFPQAGVYVLRSARDHVFVDAGPVGMRGRGGHGHNDCLSFEAVLDGSHVFVDSGAYVYTASFEWRNRFRGTGFHNTPIVDGHEQNRFVDPLYLWSLRADAVPTVEYWSSTRQRDILRVSHAGYTRLSQPVRVVRTFALDRQRHRLVVGDEFVGAGDHVVCVPYHLSPSLTLGAIAAKSLSIDTAGAAFVLRWESSSTWDASFGEGWVSPSYGIKKPAPCLELRRSGALAPLVVVLARSNDDSAAVLSWARHVLKEAARDSSH